MKGERWVVGVVLALALVAAWQWDHRPLETPPGILAEAAPLQESTGEQVLRHGDYVLTKRARFEVRARVLPSERYWIDSGADLAPIDLALGWGPMSDQSVLDNIDVHQGRRWYFLRWSDPPPIPESQIMGHSGNMHMVPAEPWVSNILKDARPGQVISLRGFLVDAQRKDGWHWKTSLSRHDTGDGSCELVYVEYAVLES